MTLTRGIVAVILRVIAFAALYVIFLVVLSGSDSTDPLGPGLLFFLIVFVVALVWSGLDALRHGFVEAAALWAVTAVLAGAAMTLVFVLTTADANLGEELTGSTLFFALLLFVPALLGASAGGLAHRVRRPAEAG